MLPDDQDRIHIILVRARNPSNIGAAARAMHDLGFRHLRIVNEFPVPFQAAKSAVDASSVLLAAREFPTVAEAVADCTQVFGTTAVGERVLEHPLHPLPEAAQLIRQSLIEPETRIAILFGSEKTGLSNEELSHCNALLTIPMNPVAGRHLSMNLGQAVAVILYELSIIRVPHPHEVTGSPASVSGSLGWFRVGSPATQPTPADSGHLERLTTLLRDLLETSGYTARNPANAQENRIRRLVRRMSLTALDATLWTGILRQLQHAIRPTQPKEKAPHDF